jgi:hypothetical protein
MTLAELLIAAALTLTVIAGVFTAVVPAQATFAAEQERTDLQQRLRVAVETLAHDVRMAAGVRPYRVGAIADDAAAGLYYRPDVITVVFPVDAAGMAIDDASRTYYIERMGAVWQLRQYDGKATTFPLLDDVVVLGFEYLGDTQPPQLVPDSDPDDMTVSVTYGPAPPPIAVDDPADMWGTGENCIVRIVDGAQVARLPALAGTAPVSLTPAVLTDGPWCPDPAHPARFDADLLRVRLVRVRLRLQAPASFRGPSTQLFMYPGRVADVRRHVPDHELRFDVMVRNWNVR